MNSAVPCRDLSATFARASLHEHQRTVKQRIAIVVHPEGENTEEKNNYQQILHVF